MGDSWWEIQIRNGWKGPMAMPRGSSFAAFPLKSSVRYRVSHDPTRSHLLMAGTDYAYCGMTLALDETWLIETGYDEFYWIVEDPRGSNVWCNSCSTWQKKWRGKGPSTVKVESPIGANEWAATVGAETLKRKAKLDSMADTIAAWFGPGAERVIT